MGETGGAGRARGTAADGPTLERARGFLAAVPYARALGMRLDAVGVGRAMISMGYDARLVGDPGSGVIHGGAVSALMDTSCGTAVLSLPEAQGTATIDLRIDYMRPARPGRRITARASVFHVTRSVVFLRATATDDAEEGAEEVEDVPGGVPVATATGTFTIERAAP